MIRTTRKYWLPAILICISSQPLFAQADVCESGLAEAFLDANNVRARILNTGGLFWRGTPYVYEVPKYSNAQAIFASSVWIAGMINNELHASASRYGPWEFWPGPLDEKGNTLPDCGRQDEIFEVYLRDIIEYDEKGIISENLRKWPWQLGAPVIDGDGNPDNYDLSAGDRPEIMGHQTLWWVMNDKGGPHATTESEAIGLEVQVTAFAAASSNAHINNATLYKYKLIYKGNAALEDAYFSIFQDVDLGIFKGRTRTYKK